MNWKRFVSIVAVLGMLFAFSATAMAETHTRFVTGNPTTKAPDNTVFIISNTLDFSDLRTTGPSGTGALSGVTRSDVVQLLDIPAGTYVLGVGASIYSAWTTSGLTCSGVLIGDGSGTSGWIATMDWGPTASGTSTTSGVTGMGAGSAGEYIVRHPGMGDGGGGKYYSAADTIDAVIPAGGDGWGGKAVASALTDFQLQIWAVCIKPSTQEAYTKPSPAI